MADRRFNPLDPLGLFEDKGGSLNDQIAKLAKGRNPSGTEFFQQVRSTVERHGEKGRRLWTLASGYNPMVPPAMALANLKNMVDVIKADFEDEAKSLIRDLEQLFKQ